MLPSEDDSTFRILSSISFNDFLFCAPCRMSWFFSSARSGLSFATTTPRSWSSKPSSVIMKLISDTLVHSSGV